MSTCNLDNPILADIRVRQALLYAHRPARSWWISCSRACSRVPTADSFVSPLQHPVCAPRAAALITASTCRRARALLAEAGWTPGDDGICKNAAGDRLSMAFVTTAGNRLRELQQQVMQSQWKCRICVEVRIKNEPARTFFGESLKQRSFGGMAMYAWTFGVSHPPRQTLASDQIPTAANGWGGGNYHGLPQPEDGCRHRCAAEQELDVGEAQAGLGRHAAHLCRATAGAAAVLPRRRPRGAEMAEGRDAHRAPPTTAPSGPRPGDANERRSRRRHAAAAWLQVGFPRARRTQAAWSPASATAWMPAAPWAWWAKAAAANR